MLTNDMTQDKSAVAEPVTETELDETVRDESIPAIAFAIVFLLVGIWFFINSLGIKTSAAIWPRSLAVLLIGLSLVQIGKSIAARIALARSRTASADVLGFRLHLDESGRRRLLMATWLLAYSIVALYAGFGVTMLVFLPTYMWFAGYRRPVAIAAITVAATIGMTLLFDTVVGVRMWEGGY